MGLRFYVWRPAIEANNRPRSDVITFDGRRIRVGRGLGSRFRQTEPIIEMSESIHDELFWTAVQYASGDLADEAAAEFEQRLETDQSACEALARAVALAEAVRQAEALPPVPTVAVRRSYAAVLGWAAVATAACLALAFAYDRAPQEVPVAGASAGDAQLAAAWLAGQDDVAIAAAEATLSAVDEDDDFELPPLSTEPTAPDWLIAALADAESSPMRGEN